MQVAVLLSLFSITIPYLQAQGSLGAISGSVTDSTGAAIAGAKVTITNLATAVSRTLTSDSGGFYSAEGLSTGQYKIVFSATGCFASRSA